jgi:TonB family protein
MTRPAPQVSRRIPEWGLCWALLATSACASSGPGSGTTCTSALAPHAASANAVVDSAAAQQRLAEGWWEGSGRVFASLRGPAEKGPSRSTVYSEGLTPDQESQIGDVLEELSRIPVGSDERAYFVIGNAAGPTVRRIERLGQCAPRIINRTILTERIAIEANGLNITRRMVVRLFVRVGEDGVVDEVRVDESSGDVDVDLAAARVFRGVTFAPAQVEGIPTRVWAALPVNFAPSG